MISCRGVEKIKGRQYTFLNLLFYSYIQSLPAQAVGFTIYHDAWNNAVEAIRQRTSVAGRMLMVLFAVAVWPLILP